MATHTSEVIMKFVDQFSKIYAMEIIIIINISLLTFALTLLAIYNINDTIYVSSLTFVRMTFLLLNSINTKNSMELINNLLL